MELNNYRSVTPLKKKRKKITVSAALVICFLCLIIGILCGRAVSSNKQAQEASERIAQIEQEMEIESKRLASEIGAYKDEINRLKNELADANRIISQQTEASNQAEAETEAEAEEEEAIACEEEEKAPVQKKSSGGFLRILLIIILVVIIIVCLLFAASVFLRKNDDEDDEYDDEDYDDEEYEEDYDEEDEEVIEEMIEEEPEE